MSMCVLIAQFDFFFKISFQGPKPGNGAPHFQARSSHDC